MKNNNLKKYILIIIGIILLLAIISFVRFLKNQSEKPYNKVSFVVEAQSTFDAGIMQFLEDYDGDGVIYSKSNGVNCSNYIENPYNTNYDYYMKIEADGKVTKFIFKSDRQAFYYEGDNIDMSDIKKEDVISLDNQDVIIPSCN